MSVTKKSKNLFIILDGNSIMHRSFHALPPLTTKSGELVNAVFGFASILMTILTRELPQYVACAFDTKAKTFRHEKYEDYKAGRVKAPDEFYQQIPRIHELVETMNIPILKQDGYEADDIIGTVVKRNEEEHPRLHNKIVTSDMDAMQLVTEKTCVGNLHKGYKATECFYPDDVYSRYLVRPEQVVDYKAIMGDASDNIPGVKGIGKKGAQELLQLYTSLDGVYEHLDEIKGKKQELLREQREQAYFSQELATIKCDVKIPYSLKDCESHDFDTDRVIQLFDSLQFYSLIRRLGEWQKQNGVSKAELTDIFATAANSSKSEKTPGKDQGKLF